MRAIAFCIAVLLSSQPRAQEAVAYFGAAENNARETLVIHGSTDIDPFSPILVGFAAGNPDLRIRYEQRSTNDIYALAARACAEGAASAGLLISSSIDQQVKLVNDGCAQPHRSAMTGSLPPWANWRDEIFGLTLEAAVMVYNRELVPPEQVPQSRFDLIDLLRPSGTAYSGRIATYDIEQSGLGYLFAFADSQQAGTFGRLVEAFGRNNVVATCCSAEIIDGVASGDYLIAYNMLGSYALARASADQRIGIVAPSDYTLLLSRAAIIPRGAPTSEAAKTFIDFALSEPGRRLLTEASLIVAFDEDAKGDMAVIRASSSSLRPLAFSPILLAGLDNHKKRLFSEFWRSAVLGTSAAKP